MLDLYIKKHTESPPMPPKKVKPKTKTKTKKPKTNPRPKPKATSKAKVGPKPRAKTTKVKTAPKDKPQASTSKRPQKATTMRKVKPKPLKTKKRKESLLLQLYRKELAALGPRDPFIRKIGTAADENDAMLHASHNWMLEHHDLLDRIRREEQGLTRNRSNDIYDMQITRAGEVPSEDDIDLDNDDDDDDEDGIVREIERRELVDGAGFITEEGKGVNLKSIFKTRGRPVQSSKRTTAPRKTTSSLSESLDDEDDDDDDDDDDYDYDDDFIDNN